MKAQPVSPSILSACAAQADDLRQACVEIGGDNASDGNQGAFQEW